MVFLGGTAVVCRVPLNCATCVFFNRNPKRAFIFRPIASMVLLAWISRVCLLSRRSFVSNVVLTVLLCNSFAGQPKPEREAFYLRNTPRRYSVTRGFRYKL